MKHNSINHSGIILMNRSVFKIKPLMPIRRIFTKKFSNSFLVNHAMRRKKSKLTDSFYSSSRYQSLLRPLPNQLHCLNQSLSSKFYLFKSPIDNNSLNFIVFSFFPLMDKNYTIFRIMSDENTFSFRYNSIVRNR